MHLGTPEGQGPGPRLACEPPEKKGLPYLKTSQGCEGRLLGEPGVRSKHTFISALCSNPTEARGEAGKPGNVPKDKKVSRRSIGREEEFIFEK